MEKYEEVKHTSGSDSLEQQKFTKFVLPVLPGINVSFYRAVKMANNVGVFFLLLIFAEFSDADILTTSNYNNSSDSESPTTSPTTSIPAKNHTQRCLKTLNEIERELSSTIPPLDGWITDNYRNISRALFPALKLPSLYIKITLQFLNETGNEKTLLGKVNKFTWSESCMFVSVKQISLTVMTVFSLGTVCPQRRQTELVLTVPPLCEGASSRNSFKDDNEMWRYVLLTLQDIAIIPNVSDPRLNTAQCVVLGHEGDIDQPIDYAADGYIFKCWWILLAVSFLLTIPIFWYAYNWFEQTGYEGYCFKTVSVSGLLVFLIMLLLLLIPFCIQQYTYSIAHLVLFCISGILVVVVPRIKVVVPRIITYLKGCEIHKWRIWVRLVVVVCKIITYLKGFEIHKWRSWVIFSCINLIVHHLLWVLCAGIPADPSWAVPLFLCECLALLILVCAIYMYYKDITDHDRKCKAGHLFLSVFAIWLVIFTVVISFYNRSTAVSTENFLEIIMAAVLLWVIKNSGLNWENVGTPVNPNAQATRGNSEQIPLESQNQK